MFGWFTPKCPVDAGMKRWVEARMGWLLGQFGETKVLSAPMILPNAEYYPDPYDGSEEAGQRLFVRTCEYMNVDPKRLELKFYQPERKGRFKASIIPDRTGWAGLYDADEESQKTIWIDKSLLEDAEGLVATFAHELSHVILLGENRMPREMPDMEQMTDLATVVLGLGIFNANVSFRKVHIGYYLRTSRIGYLLPDTFGYALALFAWLRGEEKATWSRYLNTSMRIPFKEGIGYLRKMQDAAVDAGESLDSISWHDVYPEEEIHASDLSRNSKIYDAELKAAEESQKEEDLQFADGYNFSENGQWQEAAEAFSIVIEQNPDDGEAYQERAWAYLELGRIAEAVADAEKAVDLMPEESGAYLVRGTAYSQSQQYEQAIADLNQYLNEEDYWDRTGTSATKAYYFRGLAFAGLNDFKQALKDLSKAITRWPRWPDPYQVRAIVYEQLGQSEKAAKDREEAACRATRYTPD
jgi:tetratricopeptide (TPR) repeat protein